ncbi:dihydroneopterin aldolase [Nocardioides sp. SYSU DS0651]|uniref:dihydroneopterin aldolase n=1 Tax=Nocardioides sp. SYSU DS0651 TaxID=3415955 RepID=UPI003F4BE0F1
MSRHDERGEQPQDQLDELRILGIEVHAHHGVFDHERRDGQTFRLDLVLGVDTRPAAESDDLRDTVDYGSLVDHVVSEVSRDPVDLIETLAQRIADACLLDRRVEWARVTVHKPDAPIQAEFDDVQLTITRRRRAAADGGDQPEREGQG